MINRLKQLRKDILKLSQEQFAKEIGLARSTLSLLEKGERNINERIIKLVCQVFNVNEDWLRNGNEPIFVEENDNHINALIKKYEMNYDEINIIKKFINLDENLRNKLVNFMFEILKENIDKVDENKLLHYANMVENEKIKLIARGKGIVVVEKDEYDEIIKNAKKLKPEDYDKYF